MICSSSSDSFGGVPFGALFSSFISSVMPFVSALGDMGMVSRGTGELGLEVPFVGAEASTVAMLRFGDQQM